MLFRVVIHWTFNGLSFMTERAALADEAGQALTASLESVRADRADTWRALVERATSLQDFAHENSFLPVVNGNGETVRSYFGVR